MHIYDNPELVTEAEPEHDLRVLPQWRRDKALAFHHLTDRVQSAKAFLLLQQCLSEQYGIKEIPNFENGQEKKLL